jgi:hypothetical protein
MRSRIIERFGELEDERTQINDRLAALDRATVHQDDPGLLDALPLLGDALPELPASIQARLFAAFDLEMIYNQEDHQVTIYAAITPAPQPPWPRSSHAVNHPQSPPTRLDWPIPRNTPESDGCHNHHFRWRWLSGGCGDRPWRAACSASRRGGR